MDLQTADRLRSTVMQDLRSQLVWGLPTARDEATIRQLRRQLEEGDVSVRLHLRHSLHGKLYLCHRNDHDNPRTGYVGSSNLTFSGLVKQGELKAAVIVAEEEWQLPLIVRTDDGGIHAGQVALPGGALLEDETIEDAALREAHEEVGLASGRVTLLGRLSTLPIPISPSGSYR